MWVDFLDLDLRVHALAHYPQGGTAVTMHIACEQNAFTWTERKTGETLSVGNDEQVYREAYKGEENASFAATLHNLGMTFRTMAQQGNTLEKVPLLERAQETFQRCVEIREKVRWVTIRQQIYV